MYIDTLFGEGPCGQLENGYFCNFRALFLRLGEILHHIVYHSIENLILHHLMCQCMGSIKKDGSMCRKGQCAHCYGVSQICNT